MITIGIAGTNKGCGVTHYAISLANTLIKNKQKVALLEKNSSNSFLSLGREMELIDDEEDFDGDYFTYKNIDYFVKTSKSIIFALKSAGYEYVIIDYGTEISEDFYTSDCLVLVMTGAEWKRGSDEVFEVCEEISNNVGLDKINIIVPFSTKDRLEAIRSFAPKTNVIATEYDPDCFSAMVDFSYLPKAVADSSKRVSKLEKKLMEKDEAFRKAEREAQENAERARQKEKELKEKEKEIKEHKSIFDRFKKTSEEEKQRIQREAEEEQRRLQEEKQRELAEAQRKAEEEKKRLEEEARAEQERLAREEEEKRKALAEQKEREKAELARQAELEKAELERRKEEEKQRELARAEAEKAELARKAEEEQRRLAEEKARAEEEKNLAELKAREEQERAEREARRAEEEKAHADEKARIEREKAEKEAEERHREIEAEALRQAEEERLRAEEEKRKADEAHERAEAERQKALELEEKRNKALEEYQRLTKEHEEQEEAFRKAEEEKQRIEEEKRLKEEELETQRFLVEQQRKQHEEEQRRKEEEIRRAKEEAEKYREEKDTAEYNATHDPMTDAGNRAGLKKHMDKVLADSSPYRIVGFDINNLKKVNDGMGHTYGDDLIMTISGLLMQNYEHLFRTGGDEFVAVTDLSDPTEDKLKAIDETLAQKSVGSKIVYQVAYGWADSTEAGSYKEVSDIADERMYENKKRKKGETVYEHSFIDEDDNMSEEDYEAYIGAIIDEENIISDEEIEKLNAEYECIPETSMETPEVKETDTVKYLSTMWWAKGSIAYDHLGSFGMNEIYIFPVEYQTAPRTVKSLIVVDLDGTGNYEMSLNTTHKIAIGTAEFDCNVRFTRDGGMMVSILDGNPNTELKEKNIDIKTSKFTPRYFGKRMVTKNGEEIEVYPIKENYDGTCDCIIRQDENLYISNGIETEILDVPVSFLLNEDDGTFEVMKG